MFYTAGLRKFPALISQVILRAQADLTSDYQQVITSRNYTALISQVITSNIIGK